MSSPTSKTDPATRAAEEVDQTIKQMGYIVPSTTAAIIRRETKYDEMLDLLRSIHNDPDDASATWGDKLDAFVEDDQ